MQAIKDIGTALVRNQWPEGTLKSQGLVEFKRNKPQFFGGYNPENFNGGLRK